MDKINTKEIPDNYKFQYRLACKDLLKIKEELDNLVPLTEDEYTRNAYLNSTYLDHYKFINYVNSLVENPPFKLTDIN